MRTSKVTKGYLPISESSPNDDFYDTPYDGMTKEEYLKWKMHQGEVEPIGKEKYRKRKMKLQEYVIVPRWISMIPNDTLNGNAKLVLSDIVGVYKSTKSYFRTNKGIAEAFGLTVSGVRGILKKLLQLKLIESKEKPNSAGNTVRYLFPKEGVIRSLSES